MTAVQRFADSWLREFKSSNRSDELDLSSQNPQSLVSSCQAISFKLGTGHQLLDSILSTCELVQEELIIVTCFWATSTSQEAVASLLSRLSTKAVTHGYKIRVRICFSSLSITQKLFQTSSLDGKIYPPSTWTSLGLPDPEVLIGLDLMVKSVFVRPFSVMHPKFILMDRQRAFMPSCNVSWEKWFEGCIEMEGEIVQSLFEFWVQSWSRNGPPPPALSNVKSYPSFDAPRRPSISAITDIDFPRSRTPATAILLPSSHHMNPRFCMFSVPEVPPTPLNTFLLHAIAYARSSIYIQTPNLTCYPVIGALTMALSRGVNVHIVTSSRLMILEQLVTAGTVTEFEVWKLRRRHSKLLRDHARPSNRSDLESLSESPGELKIGYYHPKNNVGEDEPVKSHFKCTIIDEEVIVLGSGNLDRASWYTSQELGVAILCSQVAKDVMNEVAKALEARVAYVC